MGKPDVKGKAEELQRWIDDEVRPYLQKLLDRAQRKLRSEIRFYDSLGVCYIDFGSRRSNIYRDWKTQAFWEQGEEGDIFFRRFPELFELRTIVYEIDNLLNLNVGDIVPIVRPLRRSEN